MTALDKTLDKINNLLYIIEREEKEVLLLLRNRLYEQLKGQDSCWYSRAGVLWEQFTYDIPCQNHEIITVGLKLKLLNKQMFGYFGFASKKLGESYQMPILVMVDGPNNQLCLANGENGIPVQNFSLNAGRCLNFQFTVYKKTKQYDLIISDEKKTICFTQLNFTHNVQDLDCIDQLVARHENSYRFVLHNNKIKVLRE